MTEQSQALDLHPPDWQHWAVTADAYAAECNAHQPARRQQAIPEHRDLITRLSAAEEAELYAWLERE